MAYPGQFSRLNTALGDLLSKAETQGYLTQEDISDSFPWEDEEALENLFTSLRRRGVDLLFEDASEDPGPTLETEFGFPTASRHPYLGLEQLAPDDTVGLYFKEMSRVPLLSIEEEIQLAQRIECARQAVLISNFNGRLPIRQRRELETLIQDGLQARDQWIKANTRLVVSGAKRYIGRGVPFLDLIQEGNLGLMRAVEKFEPKRGFRFSTYATWWIRQTITRAIADQGRTIRVPVHMSDRIRQMYRLRTIWNRNGRPATNNESAEEMGVDSKKVKWMLRVSWTPISLESPLGDDEEAEFGMFVEDETTPSPAQVVYQEMLRERVNQVLSTLSPREARILRLRFGLGEDQPHTLEEVGQKFGLTENASGRSKGKFRAAATPQARRMLREYL
jgi:RNA polymerase primary sigma factor